MNLGEKMKSKLKKQRHQVKSRWHYIFWGTATLSVFAGQMYVGTGYRKMSESLDRVLDAPIVLDFGRVRRDPMIVPRTWDLEEYFHADPMVIQ